MNLSSITLKFRETFSTENVSVVYYNGMATSFITRESTKIFTTVVYQSSIKKNSLLNTLSQYPYNCCLYHLSSKS